MAQLPPDGRLLIQQIDGTVILYDRDTEEEYHRFDPSNANETAQAQGKIWHDDRLTDEQRCFAIARIMTDWEWITVMPPAVQQHIARAVAHKDIIKRGHINRDDIISASAHRSDTAAGGTTPTCARRTSACAAGRSAPSTGTHTI